MRSHSSGVLIRREKSRGVLPSSERIITVIVLSQIMTQCCSAYLISDKAELQSVL